jgi:hypothetical protein
MSGFIFGWTAWFACPQLQRGNILTEFTPNGTFIGPSGIMTSDIVFTGIISGPDVTVKDELMIDQVNTSSGLYFKPSWSPTTITKKSQVWVRGVTLDGKGETHELSLEPNVDNSPYNGIVSTRGDFNVWDKENNNFGLFVRANDFTRKGKQIPYGNHGSTQLAYSDQYTIRARVNINFPTVPYVVCTPQWTSGAVSTSFINCVWVENVSTTGFDICARDASGRFNSNSYIWILWHAFCYDQTYT